VPYRNDYGDDGRQLLAGDQIVTPDDNSVRFAEDEQPGDISVLIRIRDEAGEEALTDEEYAILQMYEQSSAPSADAQDHYANLAEHIDEAELSSIAQDVVSWVKWDEDARAEWYEMEKRGIRALGVTPDIDGGADFDGAATVVHPLLAEAVVQFASRQLEAMWPAGGPVKSAVFGKITPELQEQGKRVEQFLNYQYTEMMPGAFEQVDKMLVRLPLSGSCFVKVYYDPIDGVCRSLVEPADFIVPYRSTDLRTTPRYTERILMSRNDVKKRQVAGFYRDVELSQPHERSGESSRETVIDEIKGAEGLDETTSNIDDDRHTLYECCAELDIKGFEDVGEDGEPTGISLPYVITVDRDSQKVLSIYRNWKQNDQKKKRVVYHIHYRFMPGLGFYGFGFYHWIGGLAKSATGALRALLDSAHFSNMPGGYKARDAKFSNGVSIISPGEWADVDCDSDELRKAFFPLPYKEPSAVLFNLLGLLQDLGRRFAGTTEALVGGGSENTPVGTILARIEQGSKVQTAIQKRLHEAAKEEFRLIAWLDSMYLPQEYPYAVVGEDRSVMSTDFDDKIDVTPVSDPNFVSHMQRYFAAQIMLELAEKFPGLYDIYEINKRALEALRADDIDSLLPPKDKIKRADPVTENAQAMVGKPLKAYPDQSHESHMMVHQQLMQSLPQGHPATATIGSHVQEHMALAYLMQMQMQTGVAFMMPGDDDDDQQEVPPDIENQIAMLAAQSIQQMQQQQQQPDPQMMALQAEQQRKDAVAQSDIARKDAVARSDIERKDATAMAELQRQNTQQINDLYARNQEI